MNRMGNGGLGRGGMDWIGLGRNRMDRDGLGWNGMNSRDKWENGCWSEKRLHNVNTVGVALLGMDRCLSRRFRGFCSGLRYHWFGGCGGGFYC